MATTPTPRSTGMGLVVAGLLTFVISTQISGGFFRGLFQGMTIALMVGGAYLLSTRWRQDRRSGGPDEEDPDALWLPSQDDQR